MKKILFILFSSLIVLFSCVKEKAQEPQPSVSLDEVKFAADVQPIFQASCGTGGACHGTSSGADGKVYETHAGAFAADEAKTLGSIKHASGFKQMPQGGAQLSAEKIAIIEAWINGGKKND